MPIDKSLLAGSTGMLLLRLLADQDMYGYQMIEELARRSDHTFALKAGTLYPLLHQLEEQGMLTAYEAQAPTGRSRRYYRITKQGKACLAEKEKEWNTFADAVKAVLA